MKIIFLDKWTFVANTHTMLITICLPCGFFIYMKRCWWTKFEKTKRADTVESRNRWSWMARFLCNSRNGASMNCKKKLYLQPKKSGFNKTCEAVFEWLWCVLWVYTTYKQRESFSKACTILSNERIKWNNVICVCFPQSWGF